MYVCARVCVYVCVWKLVIKRVNINLQEEKEVVREQLENVKFFFLLFE